MNNLLLFAFSSARDLSMQSEHSQLMEFYQLDKEIGILYDKLSDDWLEGKTELRFNPRIMSEPRTVKCEHPFHSLELALMIVRAKSILRNLNIIKL